MSHKSHIMDAETRFWHYVDITSNCWKWTGATNNQGYGRFSLKQKYYLAHRFMYTLVKGPIPENMLCLHKCDNPICINPDHLYLGDQKQNIKDMVRRTGHNNAKFYAEEVENIVQLYKQGLHPNIIAEIHDCSTPTIRSIINFPGHSHKGSYYSKDIKESLHYN